MQKIVVSSLEKKILALFLLGLVPQFLFLKLSFAAWIILFYLGMLFEFLTEAAWNYNPVLLKSTFTVRDRDVNWIFGLGWQATIVLGLSLGLAIHGWFPGVPAWAAAGLGLGLVGNAMEGLFLRFGLWKYNLGHWIVTLGTGRPRMLGAIPVSVRVGYFPMGAGVFGLVAWLLPRLIAGG